MISIHWAGITPEDEAENQVWCEDFIAMSKRRLQQDGDSSVDGDAKDKNARECRGGCGAKDVKNMCSRCKETCKPLLDEPLMYSPPQITAALNARRTTGSGTSLFATNGDSRASSSWTMRCCYTSNQIKSVIYY